MNVRALLFQLSRILILAAVVLPLSDRFAVQANAEIITDGEISGFAKLSTLVPDHNFSALGQYDAVFDDGFNDTVHFSRARRPARPCAGFTCRGILWQLFHWNRGVQGNLRDAMAPHERRRLAVRPVL